MVNVAGGRQRLDAVEAGIFDTAGQYHMRVQLPFRELVDGSEDHPHLEADARLSWCDQYWPARLSQFDEATVHGEGVCPFAFQEVLDGKLPARVFLVAVGKLPSTFRACPQRRHG